jgi:3-hydroxyacyl-[acyl-carrier-protein] dehydratase
MNDPWYSLLNSGSVLQNSISAKVAVPKDSPWFSGHFPGEPILPGIAELSMVFDLIKNVFSKNSKNVKLISLKKIRFKYIVKPEEILDIVVTSVENLVNTYSFIISCGENITCSGIISVTETN